MEIRGEGLLEAVKRHEVEGLHNFKTRFPELSALEILLNDYYGAHQPSCQDYNNRRHLIRYFNDIAREIYRGDAIPVVEEFGSFVMELFSAGSDLDLSINFSDAELMADRALRIKTLRNFARKLYVHQKRGQVTNIQIILSARVPVVKVTDRGTGVECDLSVGNLDGIARSKIVFMVSSIDERFRKLSCLLKAWAKVHDINSSKDGTLNSLSLILIAAFHLQTRDIPILPPFSAILKDGLEPVDVEKNISKFLNYGVNNKESLAELFVSLLVKLQSVEELWSKGICASTYEGSWICKKLGAVSIEDFLDRSQNAARSLKSKNKSKIYTCICRSVEHISHFSKGLIDAAKLKLVLFGADPAATSKIVLHTPSQPLRPGSLKKKRKRNAQNASTDGEKISDNPGKIFPGNGNGLTPSNAVDAVELKHVSFEADPAATSKNVLHTPSQPVLPGSRKKKRKRHALWRAQNASTDGKKISDDPGKIFPGNVNGPTPSNAVGSRMGNVSSTYYTGAYQPRESPGSTCNQPLPLPNLRNQSYGPQPFMSNLPLQDYRRVNPGNPEVGTFRTPAPSVPRGQPFPSPGFQGQPFPGSDHNVQSFGRFLPQTSGVQTWHHTTDRPYPGRQETPHAEHVNYAAPNLAGQSPFHPPFHGARGFRCEGFSLETRTYAYAPPHQPQRPHVPFVDPIGLERSYGHYPGHRPYQPHGHSSYMPFSDR